MKKAFTDFIRLDVAQKVLVPIYFGNGLLNHINEIAKLDSYSRVVIITDTNVFQNWGSLFKKVFAKDDLLILTHSGENHKNFTTVKNIWAYLLKHKVDRKSLIINIGGGVVCDIGAFAASTYMRGISFIQVPTTLLAMTDAAIGGKTGVNVGELKNTIGTFAQPKAIISDVHFLSTLPEREYRSGFAEIIKHALVADKLLFNDLSKKDLRKLNKKAVLDVIVTSCNIKCDVVRKDPTESNQRKILNFGHTIGHAVEMASHENKMPLLHGEAVAIGMIAEARLSLLAGLINSKEFSAIEHILEKTKLPTIVSKSLKKPILGKIVFDKKNEGQKIKWVLLKGIGRAIIDVEQPPKLIAQAIDYILK